jgi:hypothetical protein
MQGSDRQAVKDEISSDGELEGFRASGRIAAVVTGSKKVEMYVKHREEGAKLTTPAILMPISNTRIDRLLCILSAQI